ncbi:MAG: NADH-quinone oxidoreductase subunit A [Planctomycetota bacterium]
MGWSQILSALAYIAIALAVGGGMLAVSHLLPWYLGAYRFKRDKLQPYECGVPRFATRHRQFSVKFYVMALMLALFDIESVFLITFAVNYKDFLAAGRDTSLPVLIEMLVFLGVLVFGLYYIIRRGVLDFNETNTTEDGLPADGQVAGEQPASAGKSVTAALTPSATPAAAASVAVGHAALSRESTAHA